MNFHSTGKVWENTNIPKVWVSYIFSVKQKSVQFSKLGKVNSRNKENAWKNTNILKLWFLTNFMSRINLDSFQNMKKSDFPQ